MYTMATQLNECIEYVCNVYIYVATNREQRAKWQCHSWNNETPSALRILCTPTHAHTSHPDTHTDRGSGYKMQPTQGQTRCGPYTKDYTNTTYPTGFPAQGLTDHRTRESHTLSDLLAVPTAQQTLHSSCHTQANKEIHHDETHLELVLCLLRLSDSTYTNQTARSTNGRATPVGIGTYTVTGAGCLIVVDNTSVRVAERSGSVYCRHPVTAATDANIKVT